MVKIEPPFISEKIEAEAKYSLKNKSTILKSIAIREKFETTLILKATEALKRDDQIRNLTFFLNAGFIRDPEGKIARIDQTAYPSSPISTSPLTDMFQQFRNGVGRVVVTLIDNGKTTDYYSSCFIVSKDGYAVLTAAAANTVVEGGNIHVNVGSVHNYSFEAKVVKVDDEKPI